jgi:hypothetical protein
VPALSRPASRTVWFSRHGSLSSGRERSRFPRRVRAIAAGTYADTYFGLLESLEQLFGAQVDLVVLSAIKNPYFRQSVEQNKTLVYAT